MPHQTRTKGQVFFRQWKIIMPLLMGTLIVLTTITAQGQTDNFLTSFAYSSSLTGVAANDVAGWDVAFVGDVNKDGYEDLLIGAPENNKGGLHGGAAHLIFGSANMPPQLTPLTQADVTFSGTKSKGNAGMKVEGVGDVNGDGFSDFLIAAPMENIGTGKVYLIFGRSIGWQTEVKLSDADASFVGESWGDNAGFSIAFAGDVNDDGLNDFLIGAPRHDNQRYDVGKAYLILGKTTGWTKNMNLTHAEASFVGEATLDLFGLSVAGVDDINNDGFDDIAIGAPNHNEGGKTNNGKIYLFFGSNGGWNANINASNADASLIGGKPNDLLGEYISNAGDINGDGIGDFLSVASLVNSSGKIYVIFGKLSGWIKNAIPETFAPSFIGENASNCAGVPALLNDLNLDGYSDLMVAASKNNQAGYQAGKVYHIAGKSGGWRQNVSLSTVDVFMFGEHEQDYAGHGLASGDFDGDGFPDIAIGAPGNDVGGEDAGIVYLFHSPFKQIVASLKIISPNGDENWAVGSKQQITWCSEGDIENVTLKYSTDNGVSWKKITENTDNNGEYLWTIPDDPSTTCLVRIEDAADGVPMDKSDHAFTIYALVSDSIRLISPNGGECWLSGTEHEITWNSSGSIENVKILYTIDKGKNWTTVISSTANDGCYKWTVPEVHSMNCLVKVADLDCDPGDISDATFTIWGKAPITVISPNGGECLKPCQKFEIKWEACCCLDSVKIQYSIDGGKDWNTIVYGTENGGSYLWTVPKVHSDNCLIKVADLDCDPKDISDFIFTIWDKAPITVISPNGRECIKPGQQFEIKWDACCCLDSLKIQYSIDGGKDWNMIVYGTPNDGSYLWTVPDVHSDNCLIKVADLDCDPQDISDAPFTIWGKPPITVIYPNGGNCLKSGNELEIRWEASCCLDLLKIQYSIDGGNDWHTIVYSTLNDSSYLWKIPDINSDSCLIKVADLDCDPEDVSDSLFTICSPPYITVFQPNGGDTLQAGQDYEIKWYACCFIDTVKIQYSIDGGENWLNVIYRTENDSSYLWRVPNTPSDSCLIKVADVDCDPFDVSDSFFSIVSVPMADFDATIMTGSEPLEVKFINLSTGNVSKWQWSFGDGQFSEDKGPVHNYNSPGVYTVKLKAHYPSRIDSVIKIDFVHVHAKESFVPLEVVSSTATLPQNDWTNAIDGDIYGWDGTVILEGEQPQIVFSLDNSNHKEINSVGLITDTGIGYEERWIRRFQVQISNNGTEANIFQTLLDTVLTRGNLEVFSFPSVEAKYVKLVLLSPQSELVHLGEFEVYLDEGMTSTANNKISSVPEEFRLAQNYPNPFNPTTMIKFEIPEASHVKLEIYNLLGEQITTLLNEKKNAGVHEVKWDGKNKTGITMPSGIYLYILSTGEHREVRKMILAK